MSMSSVVVRVGFAVASLLGFSGVAFAESAAVAPTAADEAVKSKLANEALLLGVTRAGKRLVAVGEYGDILLSDDEGQSWHQAKKVPTTVTLTAVDFVDDKTGWAVGHDTVILKTEDGGETWV